LARLVISGDTWNLGLIIWVSKAVRLEISGVYSERCLLNIVENPGLVKRFLLNLLRPLIVPVGNVIGVLRLLLANKLIKKNPDGVTRFFSNINLPTTLWH